MSLLYCHNSLPTLLPSTRRLSPARPPPSAAVSLPPVSRSLVGPSVLHRGAVVLVGVSGRPRAALTTVRVSAEGDASGPGDGDKESAEASVPVEKLPLESKVKEMTEQRLKMRLAKKLRLRRKRLLRKRKLRKKGRWPPSKMKKLKNV